MPRSQLWIVPFIRFSLIFAFYSDHFISFCYIFITNFKMLFLRFYALASVIKRATFFEKYCKEKNLSNFLDEYEKQNETWEKEFFYCDKTGEGVSLLTKCCLLEWIYGIFRWWCMQSLLKSNTSSEWRMALLWRDLHPKSQNHLRKG